MDLRDMMHQDMDWIQRIKDTEPETGCCEHGDGSSGPIIGWELLDQLNDY
jgi:hypothetical protein